jgi:predicted lipid-binding transport protein (Tim44 family)
MKKFMGRSLGLVVLLTVLLGGIDDAFAKRLGGGKSFGSRPSYSEPYRRSPDVNPTPPSSKPGYPSNPAATQRNQQVREALSRRGGWLGMLGGLALGGLLGAMLFGGAFEHINLLDLVLFAGLAYLLFRLLASRRPQPSTSTAGGAVRFPEPCREAREAPYLRGNASEPTQRCFDTDLLRDVRAAVPRFPADFAAESFLVGAKAAYRHLQQAWDEHDLAELRALVTDKVFAELQEQLRAATERQTTEVLRLEAEILEVRDPGPEREVAVLFDALLRESPEKEAHPVREVWHFVRPRSSRQPTWFLDGIQQVEE